MKSKKRKSSSKIEFYGSKYLKLRTHSFWQPLPFNKKNKQVPTSVDCIFNVDYYDQMESIGMLRAI